MPACLVKQLLIRAGIESNPGPYICPVCAVRLHANTTSVKCNKCNEWVHLRQKNNCSDLKSRKNYSPNFICRSCKHDPLPIPTPAAAFPQHPPKTHPHPNLKINLSLPTMNKTMISRFSNGTAMEFKTSLLNSQNLFMTKISKLLYFKRPN